MLHIEVGLEKESSKSGSVYLIKSGRRNHSKESRQDVGTELALALTFNHVRHTSATLASKEDDEEEDGKEYK
ncbi:hypothetical protein E2C01_074966 [Portunus trituberculatus]|uniref:Uncharacterized protein n=1 Tax=Portunus trituberculatus TaxID=210409 RepID=A0A5B7IHV5_PORTR|nr:hypothetical protein [Portunus trituberculatus]